MTKVKLIDATPGLGKSEDALVGLKKCHDEDWLAGHTRYFCPTLKLANEAAERYRLLGGNGRVIRGRTHDMENGNAPCIRAPIVKAAMENGVRNITEAFCEQTSTDPRGVLVTSRCPHFHECPYQQQFKDHADVTFLAHDYLFIPMTESKLPPARRVIIDENMLSRLVAYSSCSVEQFIESAGDHRDVALAIVEAFKADKNPATELRALKPAHVPKDLPDSKQPWSAKGLRAMAAGIEAGAMPPIRPAMQDEQISAAIRRRKPTPAARIFRRVADEMAHDRPLRSAYIVRDVQQQKDGVTYRADVIFCQHRKKLRGLPDGVPVLLLDGTADPELLRPAFPTLRAERISVRRNATVIQTHGFSASKTIGMAKDKSREEIGHFLRKLPPDGLLVTYKEAEEAIELPPGWSSEHFGNLRGIDAHKDRDVIVVVGRQLVSVYDAERTARGLFYDQGDVELKLGQKYEERPIGFNMTDGTKQGVMATRHPCPIVERVRWSICEGEVEQAVDRLRLVHNEKPKTVILINSMPIRIEVDLLVNYKKLVRRDRLAEVMTRTGGFLPISGRWLVKRFPELWPSTQAAKFEIHEAETDGGDLIGRCPEYLLPPLSAPRYEFRVAGKPGRYAQAVYSWRTAAEVQAWVEAQFGALSAFRVAG